MSSLSPSHILWKSPYNHRSSGETLLTTSRRDEASGMQLVSLFSSRGHCGGELNGPAPVPTALPRREQERTNLRIGGD